MAAINCPGCVPDQNVSCRIRWRTLGNDADNGNRNGRGFCSFMKSILITGVNSYIGNAFAEYMAQWPEEYHVDRLSMVNVSWRESSFVGYDSVLHVAGIAHILTNKMNEAERQEYWQANAVLPVDVAQKAKSEGVGQFIFLSSMSVYGESGSIRHPMAITRETVPSPKGIYGRSKLRAEEGISTMNDAAFRVCILRPPAVYGPGAKGNYSALVKIADQLPFFPNIRNQRSMLHIGKLCKYLQGLVDSNAAGFFFPQDSEYVCTAEMVKMIAEEKGKRVRLCSLMNPVIYMLMMLPGRLGEKTRKAFGNLTYDTDMSR